MASIQRLQQMIKCTIRVSRHFIHQRCHQPSRLFFTCPYNRYAKSHGNADIEMKFKLRTEVKEAKKQRLANRPNYVQEYAVEMINQFSADSHEASKKLIDKLDQRENKMNLNAMFNHICASNSFPPGEVLEFGKTFIEHNKSTRKITCGHILSYMLMWKNYGPDNQKESVIFDLFQELLTMTDVFDSYSTRILIECFACTSQWKKCEEFLKWTKISHPYPTSPYYVPFVTAALNAKEFDYAFEILEDFSKNGNDPSDELFKPFFKSDVKEEIVYKLLNYLREYAWMLSENNAKMLRECFLSQNGDENWLGEMTTVARNRCQACKHPMEPAWTLSNADFKDLHDAVLNTAFVNTDIFMNTFPDEIEEFKTFLQQAKTYDIVVDGLNVALGSTKKGPVSPPQALIEVVNHLVDMDKSVLVIGRKHMLSWKNIGKLKGKAQTFFTNDSSADDPFMVVSALHAGKHCLILTQDQLRNHAFLLGDELRNVFRIWQRNNQVVMKSIGKRNGKAFVHLRWPSQHETRVQKSDSGWHIPYDDRSEREAYNVPDTWLCLRKNIASVPNTTSSDFEHSDCIERKHKNELHLTSKEKKKKHQTKSKQDKNHSKVNILDIMK